MKYQKLFDNAEAMNEYDFRFWLDTLTPGNIARVELHLRRQHLDRKAAMCQDAGEANCGDKYYEL